MRSLGFSAVSIGELLLTFRWTVIYIQDLTVKVRELRYF